MRIVLIRHFKTPGNLQGNYIGITDEEIITPIPFEKKTAYPKVERIYVSPLKRCIQTAQLIYPGQSIRTQEALRECDFGRFEGKNYQELSSEPAYQEWIDCMGMIPFPEGEDPLRFRARCGQGFLECVEESIKHKIASVAFVVHGGTIMSIMEAFDSKQKGFYDYQVKNGQGFELQLKEEEWKKGIHRLDCIRRIDESTYVFTSKGRKEEWDN